MNFQIPNSKLQKGELGVNIIGIRQSEFGICPDNYRDGTLILLLHSLYQENVNSNVSHIQ